MVPVGENMWFCDDTSCLHRTLRASGLEVVYYKGTLNL